MKILIVAATEGELLPGIRAGAPEIDVLITGVGMVATTYALTRHLASHTYTLVLQVGVGGSYDHSLPLGAVVLVTTEQYGDLGAEDHDDHLDIFALGLINANIFPHTGGRLETPASAYYNRIHLPKVSGLTVNMVSGNERTIAHRSAKYGCQVESMEGAAFHYVCLREGVAFAQVRAISNYVIPRDKSQWKMKDAIVNLNAWLMAFLESERALENE